MQYNTHTQFYVSTPVRKHTNKSMAASKDKYRNISATNCNGSETNIFIVSNCIVLFDESTSFSYEVKIRCNSLSELCMFTIITNKAASPPIVRDEGEILTHGRALQNQRKINIFLIYSIAQH